MYYKRNELTFLYNKEKELDRKALAMAHTLGLRINKQELNTVKVSKSLFILFIDKLGLNPKSVIDKSNPYYQNHLRGRDFSAEEWYEIIRRKPELLKAPLAMHKDKAVLCQCPNDLLLLSKN